MGRRTPYPTCPTRYNQAKRIRVSRKGTPWGTTGASGYVLLTNEGQIFFILTGKEKWIFKIKMETRWYYCDELDVPKRLRELMLKGKVTKGRSKPTSKPDKECRRFWSLAKYALDNDEYFALQDALNEEGLQCDYTNDIGAIAGSIFRKEWPFNKE